MLMAALPSQASSKRCLDILHVHATPGCNRVEQVLRRTHTPVMTFRTSATTSGVQADTQAYPVSDAPRVCILGGGFGGLYTAIKLETLLWPKGKKPKVTLIDQHDRFIFKPLLYELLNGTAQPWEVAPTFQQLLAPYAVQWVQAKVKAVEPEHILADGGSATGGQVVLANGDRVEYDWLVVALGAESDPRGVPGVKELARPFVNLDDAMYVNNKLAEFELRSSKDAVVMIVGAGYAGVELCSVIAERLKGQAVVKLVTPGADILEQSPAGQRVAARRVLDSLGVDVMTSTKVMKLTKPSTADSTVVAYGGAAADMADHDRGRCVVHLEPMVSDVASTSSNTVQQPADLALWMAGSSPVTKFTQTLPFPTNTKGSLQIDSTLRVRHHARVFAVGDVSGPEHNPAASEASFPATAQVAFQQADYAAWNVWSAINGRPLLPFRYQHLGDMMSLGMTNAAVALPFQLPSSVTDTVQGSPLGSLLALAGVNVQHGLTLEGPLAQLVRRAAYLYRQPTNEQRLSVAASWVQQAADLTSKLIQRSSSASTADRS
eukprot:jgi/Chrzof1/13014/Cz07g16140.t1